MKQRHMYAAVVLVVVLSGGLQAAIAQDDPLPDDPVLEEEPQMPGTVEGTGTYFEITDSEYLNITLESSEPVTVMLESVPEMVVLHLEAAEGATSTQITLTGFAPSTTYYKYEDDYHNLVTFTTDEAGVYAYAQDLAKPHLVFIQPNPSTLFIVDDATGGDASTIGTWDWATKTCTFGMDVTETIQIDSDGITLDGNGYKIRGRLTNGIFIPEGRTGITIQNMDILGLRYGVHLYGADGNTLANNASHWNANAGIRLLNSVGNTLANNITSSNSRWGIRLDYSDGNTLTDNTAYYNGVGIYKGHGISVRGSSNVLTGNTVGYNGHGIGCSGNDNVLTGNTAEYNEDEGISTGGSSNALTGNTVDYNPKGISCGGNDNVLTGNTAEYNGDGITLGGNNNVLIGNMTANNIRGLRLSRGAGAQIYNQIYNNNFVDNTESGISFGGGAGAQIYNNNFINNGYQMLIFDCSADTVFNLAKPVGGNYYSDWNTPDDDEDGFVDVPYVIPGTLVNKDNLPWTIPNGWSDTTPPTLSVTASPHYLSPANHKLVPVTCTLTVTDDTDPNPVVELVSLGCNEYDNAIGVGDGNTHGDMDAADGDLTVDDTEFLLRAERAGSGDGRIYTITYRATDAAGNSAEATVDVDVPKDQSSHNCGCPDCDLNTG